MSDLSKGRKGNSDRGVFRVIIDAMGGDNAPESTVRGSLLALSEWDNLEVILTGPEEEISKHLTAVPQNLTVVHTDEYIRMDDQPSQALKQKKNNSLVRGLELLREDRGDAFVYAGNTGALLEAAVLTVGRIPGIKRPALLTLWPIKDSAIAFLDSGANSENKPEFLNQFALMGSLFYKVIYKVESPRVGLLNIGSESTKGNQLYQEAFKLLSENPLINFYGNIEPEDIFDGKVDVVVVDGFTGNMVLKTAEASVKFIISKLKEITLKSPLTRLGGLILKPKLKEMKEKLDYSHLGGALLIGLNKLCIKTHGKADEIAIKNAINFARKLHENGILEKLRETLKEVTKKEAKREITEEKVKINNNNHV